MNALTDNQPFSTCPKCGGRATVPTRMGMSFLAKCEACGETFSLLGHTVTLGTTGAGKSAWLTDLLAVGRKVNARPVQPAKSAPYYRRFDKR